MFGRLLALSPFIIYTHTNTQRIFRGGEEEEPAKTKRCKAFWCCIRKDLCEIRFKTQRLGGELGAQKRGPAQHTFPVIRNTIDHMCSFAHAYLRKRVFH